MSLFAAKVESSRTLGEAFVLSVLLHAVLLSWPLSLPAASPPDHPRAGAFRPVAKPFSVTIAKLVEAPPLAMAEMPPEPPLEQAPLVIASGPKSSASSKQIAAEENTIPLVGYYPAARLSEMPAATGTFDVQPPPGGDAGLGGKVTIRIWIGADGKVDRTQVMQSGLPQAYAEAAVAAFEKLEFKPGEIGGVPVKSWVEVVVEYADFRDAVPRSGTTN